MTEVTDQGTGLADKPDVGTGQEQKPREVVITHEDESITEKASTLAQVRQYVEESFDVEANYKIIANENHRSVLKVERHFSIMIEKPPADGEAYQLLVEKPNDKP